MLHDQAPLAPLARGQVPHDAGEEVPAALGEVAERDLERDGAPLLVQAGHLEGLPRDLPPGRPEVALHRVAMAPAQILGHEDRQGLSDERLSRVAESPLDRPVGKEDRAVLVDRDDRVRRRLRHRPIELRARQRVVRPVTGERLQRIGGGGRPVGVATNPRLLKLGRSFRPLRHGHAARLLTSPARRASLEAPIRLAGN